MNLEVHITSGDDQDTYCPFGFKDAAVTIALVPRGSHPREALPRVTEWLLAMVDAGFPGYVQAGDIVWDFPALEDFPEQAREGVRRSLAASARSGRFGTLTRYWLPLVLPTSAQPEHSDQQPPGGQGQSGTRTGSAGDAPGER